MTAELAHHTPHSPPPEGAPVLDPVPRLVPIPEAAPELDHIPTNARTPVYEQLLSDAMLTGRDTLVGLQWQEHGRTKVITDYEPTVIHLSDPIYGAGKNARGIWGIRNRQIGSHEHDFTARSWTVTTYDDEGNVIGATTYSDRPERIEHIPENRRQELADLRRRAPQYAVINSLAEYLNSSADKRSEDALTDFAWNPVESPRHLESIRNIPINLSLETLRQPVFDEILAQQEKSNLGSLTGLRWHQGTLDFEIVDELVTVNSVHDKQLPTKAWVVKARDQHGRLVERQTYHDDDLKKYFNSPNIVNNLATTNLRFEIPRYFDPLRPADPDAARWVGWLATWNPVAREKAKHESGDRHLRAVKHDKVAISEANWDDLKSQGFLPIRYQWRKFVQRAFDEEFIYVGDPFDFDSGKPDGSRRGQGYYIHPDALVKDRLIDDKRLEYLLSYNDVLSDLDLNKIKSEEAREEAELEIGQIERMLHDSEHGDHQVRETLKELIKDKGLISVLQLADDLRSEALETTKLLGIPPVKRTESISWSLREIAKQIYYQKHPKVAEHDGYSSGKRALATGPVFGNTRAAIEKRREIVARAIGADFEDRFMIRETVPIEKPVIVKGKLVDKELRVVNRQKQTALKIVNPDKTFGTALVMEFDRTAYNRLQQIAKDELMEIMQRGERNEHTERLLPYELIRIGDILMKSVAR